jgi:hypothetical protein
LNLRVNDPPRRRVSPALIACGGLLVLASIFLPTVLPKMPDFEVYWNAGARVMSAAPLYRLEDGHFQHKYLPIFAAAAVEKPVSALLDRYRPLRRRHRRPGRNGIT